MAGYEALKSGVNVKLLNLSFSVTHALGNKFLVLPRA
jgi:hypothetical protein